MIKQMMAATAFALVAPPAFAQDAPAPNAPPPPESAGFHWSGSYVGLQAGYGWGADHIHDRYRSPPHETDYRDSFSIKGPLGGIMVGYNLQRKQLVLGIVADAELSGVKGDNPHWPFGDDSKTRIRWQGSLRGRVGALIDDNLFYVTGGLAVATIRDRYFDRGLRTFTPPRIPAGPSASGPSTSSRRASLAVSNIVFRNIAGSAISPMRRIRAGRSTTSSGRTRSSSESPSGFSRSSSAELIAATGDPGGRFFSLGPCRARIYNRKYSVPRRATNIGSISS